MSSDHQYRAPIQKFIIGNDFSFLERFILSDARVDGYGILDLGRTSHWIIVFFDRVWRLCATIVYVHLAVFSIFAFVFDTLYQTPCLSFLVIV